MTASQMTTPKRQIAFVADLNKCIGCQTCTVACKRSWTGHAGQDFMYWRNVETAPGQGYPRNWRAKGGGYVEADLQKGKRPTLAEYGVPFEFDYDGRLFQGKHERARPEPTPRGAPNWDEEQGAGNYPNNYFFFTPRMCNHCSRPACVEACPNDAIYRRPADGLNIINKDKCKGTGSCVEACPYGKSFLNPKELKGNKCIGCYPRIEKGVAPACVAQCAGRAMHVGYLDDTNSSVHKLVIVHKVALPMFPQFGTKPNVYYVPPALGPMMEDAKGAPGDQPKIPMTMLEEMFGKGVGDVVAFIRGERARKAAGQPSPLMDVMIGARSADMMVLPQA
jgi:DMSO reductase family type II enzyme iron-sulfur subunit